MDITTHDKIGWTRNMAFDKARDMNKWKDTSI